jgi:hypothetical protein
MRYRDFASPTIHLSATETREELIVRARMVLRRLAWKRTSPVHGLTRGEGRTLLAEARVLRSTATTRARADAPGRVFYVSIRAGAAVGRLYGPFDSQIAALEAVPLARAAAHEANHVQAAFAEFGTMSMDRTYAQPGLLNDRLPPIVRAIMSAA